MPKSCVGSEVSEHSARHIARTSEQLLFKHIEPLSYFVGLEEGEPMGAAAGAGSGVGIPGMRKPGIGAKPVGSIFISGLPST